MKILPYATRCLRAGWEDVCILAERSEVKQSWRINKCKETLSVVRDGTLHHGGSAPGKLQRLCCLCKAADGIRGCRIHSSSYASVSSQVRTKLQMVNAEALRSLPHPPPPTAHGSHCAGKLYPWRVFCISHSKIALAETQELFECSGEANQAASKRQQSKGDFKQLPLLWEEEWGEESSLV